MSKTYTATSPPRGDKAVGTEVKVPYENALVTEVDEMFLILVNWCTCLGFTFHRASHLSM